MNVLVELEVVVLVLVLMDVVVEESPGVLVEVTLELEALDVVVEKKILLVQCLHHRRCNLQTCDHWDHCTSLDYP